MHPHSFSWQALLAAGLLTITPMSLSFAQGGAGGSAGAGGGSGMVGGSGGTMGGSTSGGATGSSTTPSGNAMSAPSSGTSSSSSPSPSRSNPMSATGSGTAAPNSSSPSGSIVSGTGSGMSSSSSPSPSSSTLSGRGTSFDQSASDSTTSTQHRNKETTGTSSSDSSGSSRSDRQDERGYLYRQPAVAKESRLTGHLQDTDIHVCEGYSVALLLSAPRESSATKQGVAQGVAKCSLPQEEHDRWKRGLAYGSRCGGRTGAFPCRSPSGNKCSRSSTWCSCLRGSKIWGMS